MIHEDVEASRAARYPLGAAVAEADLLADPYPTYRALQAAEPVSWIASLGMWWVVGYDQVAEILTAGEAFTTASDSSTILGTFGPQMLSVEGADHDRYKHAARPAFQPRALREALEADILAWADNLIDGFPPEGVDLRAAFAARLPVRTMLGVFGLPARDEPLLRCWYDSFERALANFTGDAAVRGAAVVNVEAFHALLQDALDRARSAPSTTLLSMLARQPAERALSDDEIRRNAAIIMFGGISTVEALILNTIWSLSRHPDIEARVRADLSLLPRVIEEVLRWQSPVQSATRHVTHDIDFHGHRFRAGETVNCMLAAANRDPTFLEDGERFDIERAPAPRHLTFALGHHLCLGRHLARMQARIALEQLYTRCPGLSVADHGAAPRGYEFRQPPVLPVTWSNPAEGPRGPR